MKGEFRFGEGSGRKKNKKLVNLRQNKGRKPEVAGKKKIGGKGKREA